VRAGSSKTRSSLANEALEARRPSQGSLSSKRET
jgi:hypothetical protein